MAPRRIDDEYWLELDKHTKSLVVHCWDIDRDGDDGYMYEEGLPWEGMMTREDRELLERWFLANCESECAPVRDWSMEVVALKEMATGNYKATVHIVGAPSLREWRATMLLSHSGRLLKVGLI
jgi:hypothetical protein